MSSKILVTDEQQNTTAFDVPINEYLPPKHFAAFTMLDTGEWVATRGRATYRFAGDVYMPPYNTREGAVNAL